MMLKTIPDLRFRRLKYGAFQATPEKSLNASMLYFSHLRDEKFVPCVGQRVLLPETGFGSSVQHGPADDSHLA